MADSATPGSMRTAAFARYFAAVSVSAFGTALSAVALPVLVIDVLGADAWEVGLVNAAQFVPYALLGLFAGVYVDRWRRQRVLVWASIGRALSLGLIPVLWFTGLLQVWSLIVILLIFGAFSVFGFAATQSLLPQIIERRALLAANARLDQAEAAAQTAGPTLGGAVVSLLGAPIAMAVDAVSYAIDAVLIAGARITEAVQRPVAKRSLRREIAEGLRWAYRHRILGPLAWSTHVWFVANAAALTVVAVFALSTLALPPVTYGLLFTMAGIATLTGATLAPRLGARVGPGSTIVAARAVYPVAWALVASASIIAGADAGAAAEPVTLTLLFTAFGLQGLAGGVENAHEMSLRQMVTPDAMLGRVNGSMRSANRTMAAVGAVAGGACATWIGVPATLFAITAVFMLAFLIAALSPLRGAAPSP